MNLGKTWKQVHSMSAGELDSFIEAHHIEVDSTRVFSNLTEVADLVCAQLGVADPDAGDDDAGQRLDELAREYQRKHPGVDYVTCIGHVRRQHPELAKRYAAQKDA